MLWWEECICLLMKTNTTVMLLFFDCILTEEICFSELRRLLNNWWIEEKDLLTPQANTDFQLVNWTDITAENQKFYWHTTSFVCLCVCVKPFKRMSSTVSKCHQPDLCIIISKPSTVMYIPLPICSVQNWWENIFSLMVSLKGQWQNSHFSGSDTPIDINFYNRYISVK